MSKQALKELRDAWNDDWSGFDERTFVSRLNDISQMIDETMTIEEFRKSNWLCRLGKGHWEQRCSHYKCEGWEQLYQGDSDCSCK